MTSVKFEKEFCKKLPESLHVLSDIIYSDNDDNESQLLQSDNSMYSWIPNFNEDIKYNRVENQILKDSKAEDENEPKIQPQVINPNPIVEE